MENIAQTPPVEQPPVEKPIKPTQPSKIAIIVLSIVTILSLSFSGYVYLQNSKFLPSKQTLNSTSPNISNSPQDTSEIQWRQTDLVGPWSFEYPNGWHVASKWSESVSEDGGFITFVMIDPEPISGAPRGGPVSTIDITEISGTTNSETIFNEKLEIQRSIYENVTEEIVSGNIGNIYHFTGILPEGYLGGESIESYVLRIEKPNDKINERVIVISALGQKEYSDILKHIALSISKIR